VVTTLHNTQPFRSYTNNSSPYRTLQIPLNAVMKGSHRSSYDCKEHFDAGIGVQVGLVARAVPCMHANN